MPGHFSLRDLVLANWGMKLTALALAAVLWAAVAAEQPATRRLPVALQVTAPPSHPVAGTPPAVFGTFSGSVRELLKLYAAAPVVRISVPADARDSIYTVQLVPADIEIAQNVNVHPESIEPGWLTLQLRDTAIAGTAAQGGPPYERVIMGVPVDVVAARGSGPWSSEPPAVVVTVRGPRERVTRLTRDSIAVSATAEGTGNAESVRLSVAAPAGIEVMVTPDTAVVRRLRG